MGRTELRGKWRELFDQHFPAIEKQLIPELVRISADGGTAVVIEPLANEIRARCTGDSHLLGSWKVIPEDRAGRYRFELGDVGIILNFAWMSAVGWLPDDWSKTYDPLASFLVIGFGSGGGGFRGVFRRDKEVRGIYTFSIGAPESGSRIRRDVVTRWLDAGDEPRTDDCVECGSPASSHWGDGGYDCLLRSSRWLISNGVVVPGSMMSRPLGQAWPDRFRDRLVTDVRLNSTQYGKYSPQHRRIYRTFITDVPAREVADALLVRGPGFKRDEFADLISACQAFVNQSACAPREALRQFLQQDS